MAKQKIIHLELSKLLLVSLWQTSEPIISLITLQNYSGQVTKVLASISKSQKPVLLLQENLHRDLSQYPILISSQDYLLSQNINSMFVKTVVLSAKVYG